MTEQEIKAIHVHFEKYKERELGIRECFIDDMLGERLLFLDATAAVLLNLLVPLMTENRYTPLFHLREFRRKYLDVTMQSRFDDMRTSFAENIAL